VRDALGGLVDRRQVMEVQDVGVAGARAQQRPAPGADLPLERGLAEPGEDRIGRVGSVLVGGVHRHAGRVEVDDLRVQAAVEPARVAVAALRAGEDRHVPAVRRQLAPERARDVRRPAAREEDQGAEDAARHGGVSTR
jgi:hypothetical protein